MRNFKVDMGDTDKCFMYFVSSQNTRPRSFIPERVAEFDSMRTNG